MVRATCLAALATFAACVGRADGLAVLGASAVNLPAGLKNDVVRVGRGTGTVINIVAAEGGGNFYEILTADHVVRDDKQKLIAGLQIGFGDSDSTYQLSIPGTRNIVTMYGAGVDLAVVAVFVPATLPAGVPAKADITIPSLPARDGTKPAKDDAITVAGYGEKGRAGLTTVMGGDISGYTGDGSYGTLRAGKNTVADLVAATYTADSGKTYNFNAMQGAVTFDDPFGPTDGTAAIFPGDSGGPSFEAVTGGGTMQVGAHSFATIRKTLAGSNFESNGSNWNDVNLGYYDAGKKNYPILDFIDDARSSVIPEPSSACLPLAPACLLGRRRVAGRRKVV